jgi:thiol:disulfide interchange protein DsbC
MLRYRSPLIAFALLLPAAADADNALVKRFNASLRGVAPDVEVTAVQPSPIPGFYEVALGAKVLYMTEDGRYLLNGDLMDLKEKRNLSEERRAETRIEVLTTSGVDRMIEFAPPNPRHFLYVYTDIDCGYCRRFHQQVKQLNGAGIGVRYLAFPRAGIGSDSYRTAVSVWCAANPQQALTDAKAGRKIPSAQCENPVSDHFRLGEAMGVRGTPTIIMDDGSEVGGYRSAQELIRHFQEG